MGMPKHNINLVCYATKYPMVTFQEKRGEASILYAVFSNGYIITVTVHRWILKLRSDFARQRNRSMNWHKVALTCTIKGVEVLMMKKRMR